MHLEPSIIREILKIAEEKFLNERESNSNA